MGLGVQGADISTHIHAEVIVFPQDGVGLLPVAPQLVGLAGLKVAAAPAPLVQGRDVVGAPVSVHPQHRGIHRELEPAHQQLPEVRIVYVVGHEPADIRGPPGDARQAHVQPALDLIRQGLKGAGNVP